MICHVVGKMLEFLGYESVVCKNSDSALVLYRAHLREAVPFDLVLLDWSIGNGKNGLETMKAILRLEPKAKGIITSGYLLPGQDKLWREAGFSGVLAKPYDLKTLKAMVESVLQIT